MTATIVDFRNHFRQYGWAFEEPEESADLMLTGFVDSQERSFAIVITLSETFVTFALPYAPLPSEGRWCESLEQMMRLNYEWPIAKLSLDEEKALLVSVELPRDGLVYEHFVIALDLLVEAVETLAEQLPDVIPEREDEDE